MTGDPLFRVDNLVVRLNALGDEVQPPVRARIAETTCEVAAAVRVLNGASMGRKSTIKNLNVHNGELKNQATNLNSEVTSFANEVARLKTELVVAKMGKPPVPSSMSGGILTPHPATQTATLQAKTTALLSSTKTRAQDLPRGPTHKPGVKQPSGILTHVEGARPVNNASASDAVGKTPALTQCFGPPSI